MDQMMDRSARRTLCLTLPLALVSCQGDGALTSPLLDASVASDLAGAFPDLASPLDLVPPADLMATSDLRCLRKLGRATEYAFNAPGSPGSVTAADIDGDGRPDLIVANGNAAGAIALFINKGAGKFDAPGC